MEPVIAQDPKTRLWFAAGFYDIERSAVPAVFERLFRDMPEGHRRVSYVNDGKSTWGNFHKFEEYLNAGDEPGKSTIIEVFDGDIDAADTLQVTYYHGKASWDVGFITLCAPLGPSPESQGADQIQIVLKLLDCKYGFGTVKPWGMRPRLFLTGHPIAHDSESELHRGGTLWYQLNNSKPFPHSPGYRYQDGYFVDIFYYNIVTQRHLQRCVGDDTVKDILDHLGIDVRPVGRNYVFKASHEDAVKLRAALAPVILTITEYEARPTKQA
jgi:hypothetical protein